MKYIARSAIALLLVSLLAGCSNFRFPWVYKINVQQGHIITQEMVDQLKTGMTKRQVRYVLGTSLLPDTFNDDRWDYPYAIRKGSDGEITSYLFVVYFNNDKLVKYEGDFVPSRRTAPKIKSTEEYLEDAGRDTPLPTNDESRPIPKAPSD